MFERLKEILGDVVPCLEGELMALAVEEIRTKKPLNWCPIFLRRLPL